MECLVCLTSHRGLNVCDVICVQRYSLNASVSLFKMSLFFFLESIEHSFNFNFSVAIIFPAVLILSKNNAEYEYDDFPKNDGVTRSLCCTVSKLQPQNFYNPAVLILSKNNAEYEYDDFPKNDGVTRSLCCTVSKLQPQNLYEGAHFL